MRIIIDVPERGSPDTTITAAPEGRHAQPAEDRVQQGSGPTA
jgi:hypothetical protein